MLSDDSEAQTLVMRLDAANVQHGIHCQEGGVSRGGQMLICRTYRQAVVRGFGLGEVPDRTSSVVALGSEIVA
jgi:hypothetical protein